LYIERVKKISYKFKNKNKMKKTKSLKRRMNKTAILSFYNARKRNGDNSRLSEMTGYSPSHVSNVTAGRRSVNADLAEAMYSISRRRVIA
jgi:hypothetical protein